MPYPLATHPRHNIATQYNVETDNYPSLRNEPSPLLSCRCHREDAMDCRDAMHCVSTGYAYDYSQAGMYFGMDNVIIQWGNVETRWHVTTRWHVETRYHVETDNYPSLRNEPPPLLSCRRHREDAMACRDAMHCVSTGYAYDYSQAGMCFGMDNVIIQWDNVETRYHVTTRYHVETDNYPSLRNEPSPLLSCRRHREDAMVCRDAMHCVSTKYAYDYSQAGMYFGMDNVIIQWDNVETQWHLDMDI